MSKKSFYFSHDYNARNDEKILAVRMELGVEGYGIYFMLLEKLIETEDYILIKDYNRLAFDVRVSSDKIKAVIENFGLFHFTDDGKRFYSESLIRRMTPLDNIRKQRSEAGRKSAEKRKSADKGDYIPTASFQRPLQENSTTVATTVEQNFNKVKESKVNNISFLEKKKQKRERELGQSEESGRQVAGSSQQVAETEPLNPKGEAPFKKVAKKKFSPPSVEEVAQYCHERQNNINAETFWDFYQAKGWLIGKNKMKDWKAAVRTWEQKRKENANTGNNQAVGSQQSANGGRQSANSQQRNAGKISGRDNPFTIDDFI